VGGVAENRVANPILYRTCSRAGRVDDETRRQLVPIQSERRVSEIGRGHAHPPSYPSAGAVDVINGFLNYGFSILHAEVTKQLNGMGLDCFVGFYHQSHGSRLALVYDMVRPFRHLVDRSVFQIRGQIRKKDYAYSKQGIVVLSDELKSKYIQLLSVVFDKTRDYEAKSGRRRSDGHQSMEEITIMKNNCRELKDLVMNPEKSEFTIKRLQDPKL
jgi:hypothetical protein